MPAKSVHRLRVLALYTLIAGAIYLIWVLFVLDSLLGVVFFCLELGMFLLAVFFSINHWSRRYTRLGGAHPAKAAVDIFIPIKDEPLGVLKNTLKAAKAIQYADKKIYILDDGARVGVRRLAERFKVKYLVRSDRLSKQYKAANLNFGLQNSSGDFILVLDVDQVPEPNIIDDLLGHFAQAKVALVTTKQRFVVDKDDFNNDHLFYNYMQAGKHEDGAGISTGSGVVYRRSALERIGGFPEWNLLEDLYTTYELNVEGYRTVYVNHPYTLGLAPQNLRTIYKQRGNWALDSFRLIFWKMPLFDFRHCPPIRFMR